MRTDEEWGETRLRMFDEKIKASVMRYNAPKQNKNKYFIVFGY